ASPTTASKTPTSSTTSSSWSRKKPLKWRRQGSRKKRPGSSWHRSGRSRKTALSCPRPPASDNLVFREILDLRRTVAELRENFVVVRAEFRGDPDMGRCFGEMPRRAVDFQPLAVFRVIDFGHVAVGQHVGVVGGFEQGVDRC